MQLGNLLPRSATEAIACSFLSKEIGIFAIDRDTGQIAFHVQVQV